MDTIQKIVRNIESCHDNQDTKIEQDAMTSVSKFQDTQDHTTSLNRRVPDRHDPHFSLRPETVKRLRRHNSAIDDDDVFKFAYHRIGFEPGLAYNLMKHKHIATSDRVRLVTAFVISLYLGGYFQFDDASVRQEDRARRMIIGIIKGKKTLALRKAGPYFYTHYPEYRNIARNNPLEEI